ncbi:MAG: hypothetical protein ACRECQ_16210, partial [Burkholderiaceae bacterium]
MNENLRLRAPFEIARDDIERALFEQAKEIPGAHRAYDAIRGDVAERAAAELNGALNVDVFKWLTQGWSAVGAVRDAIERSVSTPGPPEIVRLDPHHLNSTSHLVLNADAGRDSLPELKLILELFVGVQSATLAIKSEKIELLAL